jgi:outer membrane receptor protein involved in Fe transport
MIGPRGGKIEMSRNTDSKYVLLAGASALALSFFGSAYAQEETAPEDDRRLGTVTVTTQKVEQSIQDVPIAVSAFDEEALNKMQLAGGHKGELQRVQLQDPRYRG